MFFPLGMDDVDAVLKGKSHNEMMQIAKSKGMKTLEDAAKNKVLAGITSIEEIHRVLTTFS